jgi:prevent-host-death family protein
LQDKPMTKLIDALSARTRFGEIMEKAEKGNTRFVVSRRGKAKVVILSVDDYLRNFVKKDELLAGIQLSAREANLDEMTDREIEAEISAFRKSRSKTK